MAALLAIPSHWKATFPAIYRLLSGTIPMSRPLIIMAEGVSFQILA